jgi:hypothetical protein
VCRFLSHGFQGVARRSFRCYNGFSVAVTPDGNWLLERSVYWLTVYRVVDGVRFKSVVVDYHENKEAHVCVSPDGVVFLPSALGSCISVLTLPELERCGALGVGLLHA